MEITDILLANTHWKTGRLEPCQYQFQRYLHKSIHSWLSAREIIALHGLRRTGKSVLLSQLAAQYIASKNVAAKQVLLFSFESRDVLEPFPDSELRELLQYFFIRHLNTTPAEATEPLLVVLDEVQNVRNWSAVVKKYYDLAPNIKFLVSGSASLFLATESESLAGRMIDFELRPLSFSEYCRLRGAQDPGQAAETEDIFSQVPKPFTSEIQSLFEEFLLFGGFPECAVKRAQGFSVQDLQLYIRESVTRRVVTRDLKKYFSVSNTLKDWNLTKVLAGENGRIINARKLASDAGYSQKVLKQHLAILESSYLISRLRKFDTKLRRAVNARYKVYFRSPSLVMSLLEVDHCLDSNLIGRVVEGYVNERLAALESDLYFVQTPDNKEVDFFLPRPKVAMEVKYGAYDASSFAYLKKAASAIKLRPVAALRDSFSAKGSPAELALAAIWQI